eukprot:CAMPEP_0177583252 /NCGR_PEP_ID=MMETSP0419_2-20121207/3217_1 /TAXON_ID=582737 /ORGANISM="Tetraselmis sp., Strain GSL018" /LENGTH=56 /DNA_ID=CAMNT_0019072619 /DNA_START=214 /DNA_END=384 /DNA_ORIENTATION=+
MSGVTLYGRAATVSVAREIMYGLTLGLTAGLGFKYWHWNERRKTEEYYAKLAKKSS